MASVKVRMMFDMAEVIGTDEITVPIDEVITIKDMVDSLIKIYGQRLKDKFFDPETNHLYPHIQFLVNGRSEEFELFKLKDGDVVSILIPIGGGSTISEHRMITIVSEPGSFVKNKTGSWRTVEIKIDASKCNGCLKCWAFCPEGLIIFNVENVPSIDFSYCKGCGICVVECPLSVFEFVREPT